MTYIPPHLRPDSEKDKLLFGKTLGKFVSTGEFPKERKKSERKHEESTLQLQFCQQVRKLSPTIDFIRHEREKQRTKFMGGLMAVFNSLDGIADFECLEPAGIYHGMYIEFKKPGESWMYADGITVKKEYTHQYRFHQKMWAKGRPAYFCNDLDSGLFLLKCYLIGKPCPMQVYEIHKDMWGSEKNNNLADDFFK